ncbi:MAG: YIP1 family protein [Bacteroidetes bacterium]|nr:YIP1 family protein [Bacteroidota bacterium]
MEETKNQEAPKMSSVEAEEFEMSHTDKLVGLFSEPGNTFSKMSKFPPKTADWITPLLIIIVVTILSGIVMMSNPNIRDQVREKTMRQVEEQFNSMIANHQMTKEDADKRLDEMRDRFKQPVTVVNVVIQTVTTAILFFIVFFIVSGVFMLFVKFGLKGTGTYKDSMVAYGLPYYIMILQTIVMVIVALVMNKHMNSTSIAAFTGADTTTIGGFLLSKADIFSIWFYAAVAIGYAKMFKSNSAGKYFAMIFGLWIGFSLLLFFLAKALPFLRWFTGA